tara:strand:- start:532 stop:1533 length:1002 start_codon:yes stop_codon:yes gene_type:complete
MSTLRINNIEAKSVPASPTLDEKIKLTNSSGDVLVHIDGKTSGITTIGINTTDGNIKFDENSNIVVTGIVTATAFHGDGSNLTNLPTATNITVADESTDTTCFPLYATAASGNLAPKTGSNLTFNSSSGNLRTGSLFLGQGSNESKTQDGLIMERNSGDGECHITAGRSGGNYGGLKFFVAGASGVTIRHRIPYNSDIQWFAPDGTTEIARLDSNRNFRFNSGYGTANTAYGVRAWIAFKAAGNANVTRGSGNATMTDHGTGDFTMNFLTAMPDTGYSMVGSAGYNSGQIVLGLTAAGTSSSPTTTGFRFTVRANYSNSTLMDEEYINLIVVR